MKKPGQHSLGRLSALLLCWLLPATVRAVVADAPPAASERNARPQNWVASAASPSLEQRAAARLAESAGCQIEWSGAWGVPTSVRGRDLGSPQAFSGGKGLAAGAPGRYEQNALAVLDKLAKLFRFQDVEKEFVVRQTTADRLGFQHVRLTQRYQGLPVVGGELIVHFDRDGQAYFVNGQYVPDLRLDAKPAITGEAAEQFARRDLAAKAESDAGKLESPPQLKILARESVPRLAYELVIAGSAADGGPARWRYWIDAESGAVLLKFNDVKRIAPPTTNGTPALITGNRLPGEGGESVGVTGWQEDTGLYYLYSTNRHWLVYNAANTGYPDAGTYAYRPSNDWAASDRVEISLARSMEVVQSYYAEVFGRNSFDHAGIVARANAHVGFRYVNAYWNGVDLSFGDGDGIKASSLAVLDICGHEYTHAVTDETAALIYAHESGALNESFSDILGTCVEFHAQGAGGGVYPLKLPGAADWLFGEDSWLSPAALRDLRNPHNAATVGAGNEQPSRYHGTFWYGGTGDNGGVHYNSGVQNFFFYLLCEGGQGSNDGLDYHVAGIGVSNAQQVAYRALTVYCTPNTDYPTARGAWLAAALDLNPAWAQPVADAWSAVGINALQINAAAPMLFRGDGGGPFRPPTQKITLLNRGTGALQWALASAPAWLSLSKTVGTLLPGESTDLDAAPAGPAYALAAGVYTAQLRFTNNTESGSPEAGVTLLVSQPDYFTEQFGGGDNDLSFQRWTFTPDESPSGYSVCHGPATNFPTGTDGAAEVSLSDDAFVSVKLSGDRTVAMYHRRTNVFFIGSNGYVTLGSGDTTFTESLTAHFALPRVSACFDDLDPAAGGTVSWKETEDRVAVTFTNVPAYGSGAMVSCQIELFYDGVIRLTCLQMGVKGGLTGLSAGQGVPPGFWESDLTAYDLCPPPDDLMVTPRTDWLAQGYAGGPFAPSGTNFTLSNLGTNPLTWSAQASTTWLSVTPPGGTLAPGAATEVAATLTAAAQQLAPGAHTAAACFTNLLSGASLKRTVHLTALPPLPPSITRQPVNLAVRPGTNLTLCVEAGGSPPLSYQWLRGGTNLPETARITGTTTSCLQIANAVEGDSGDYSVRITNAYGAVVSSSAELLVSALHHFGWNALTGTRAAGAPFDVVVTARTETGGVATNYHSSVSLTGWMGGVPGVLYQQSFEAGDLEGWTFAEPAYQHYLTDATAAGGNSSLTLIGGTGNHFDGAALSLSNLAPSRLDFYVRASATNQAGGYVIAGRGTDSFAGWVYFDQDGTMDFGEIATSNRPAYVANRWYKISFLYDWTHQRMTYLRDDQVVQANVPFFDPSIRSLAVIYFYNYDATQVWLDELRLSGGETQLPLPITPTQSGTFSNGVWAGTMAALQPATNVFLVAADSSGHRGESTRFAVRLEDDLGVALTTLPAFPVLNGFMTNWITVSNSGPSVATGVRVTNVLGGSLTLVSASVSQGTTTLSDTVVEAALGSLGPGAVATLTVVASPYGDGTLTNLAEAVREEPEFYTANNSAVSVVSASRPVLEIGDASAMEGNAGSGDLTFTMRLSPPTPYAQTVHFATADGTALAGSDYWATNGVVQFQPGETNQTIQVRVIGDRNPEPDEFFFVRLLNPSHARLARTNAVGTILTDDAEPFFDDFDPVINSIQWSGFGGVVGSTVLATNYGGAVSGAQALWFGASSNRFATTRLINTLVGGTVDFWLRLADGNSTTWESVDLPGEGIVLEYSINRGASWVEIGRYDTPGYRQWSRVVEPIPLAARTAGTQFRWRQLSHSGPGSDHWALDSIRIGLPMPRLLAGTALLAAEDCLPPNSTVDPAETVTLSLTLTNSGTLTANGVTATLLPSGGVVPLSATQNYGNVPPGGTAARPFRLAVPGACGDEAQVTLQLDAGGNQVGTVSFPIRLGRPTTVFTQDFDDLTSATLPAGWVAVLSGAGVPWSAFATQNDTPPNSVFAPDPDGASENSLTSPPFFLPPTGGQLVFQHAYSTEGCCDGGQLLISVAGGDFVEFLAAGGNFATNGYKSGSGWYGTSDGFPSFITTVADFTPAAWGQTIQLRWLLTSDYRVGGVGWYVDSIKVNGGYQCCLGCPVLLPVLHGPDQVRLQFPTVPGQSYTLQYSESLEDPNWQDLATVPGDGTVVTVNDVGSAPASRFYRLRSP